MEIEDPPKPEQCCYTETDGRRCPAPARFWVGSDGVDDYTHVCGDHVETMKREGDAVHKLKDLTP